MYVYIIYIFIKKKTKTPSQAKTFDDLSPLKSKDKTMTIYNQL